MRCLEQKNKLNTFQNIFYLPELQCAEIVSALSPSEKFEWANEQRQHGNRAFLSGDYEAAIDVYLTCLVALDSDQNKNVSDTSLHGSKSDKNSDIWTEKSQVEIQLPVLMNLAACTLRLKMFKKTKTFCDMALEMECAQSNPKVYFRRGKAFMSMGDYESSRNDLEHALALLRSAGENDAAKERDCVSKELHKLDRLVERAEINKKRQQIAMKKVLGGEPKVKGLEAEICRGKIVTQSGSSDKDQSNHDAVNSLYDQIEKRAYSTLRAKRVSPRVIHKENSYFQWYIGMIERVLRKILVWLGDEEAMTKDFSRKGLKSL